MAVSTAGRRAKVRRTHGSRKILPRTTQPGAPRPRPTPAAEAPPPLPTRATAAPRLLPPPAPPTLPDSVTPDNPGGSGGGVPPPWGGGGGPTGTKKMPTNKGPSYESWLFWWNYNKDEIINIKKAIRSGMGKSGNSLGNMADGGT